MSALPPRVTARRYPAWIASGVVAALLFGVTLVTPAAADEGRIYNPAKQRTGRSEPDHPRKLKPPPIPEPRMPDPLRSTATIPNPEPRDRGGSGYTRKGRYFYADAAPPTLRRAPLQARATVPRPEVPLRKRSAALR